VAVLAPVALGYYEVRAQQGLRRSTDDIVKQSADVADYFSAAPRLRLWGGLGPGRGEHELFPGATAIALAAVALVMRRRSPLVLLYAAILATAVVLSLGPEVSAWGHRAAWPGPYALLLRVIPGLDGLRAPARLAVVAQVALAVLAGFGAAWSVDRLRESFRPVVLAILVGVVAAEGWAAPITAPLFAPAGPPGDRDAYAYLAALPAGAVMELPTFAEDVDREFAYQYMTLVHGHRVVNGHSGYLTPLAAWLRGGHSPLREIDRQRDALEMLRGIGVRYVVVHRASYPDAALAQSLLHVIETESGQVVAHRTFGDTTVAALTPLPWHEEPAGLSAVPVSAVRAHASAGSDRLPFLFDGDVDSRWLTGGSQSGTEWLEIALDRPRDVRMVRLQLGARSFGDYPRDLAVDAVEDAGAERRLYRGSVLPSFARGLIARPEYPFIDVMLPANHARALRLRQLGTTHSFYWSIHELQLLERL
jgi:hypothetical protein